MSQDPADQPPPVLPMNMASESEYADLFAGGPGNPLAVAHEWWSAVLEGDEGAASLYVTNPSDWDFEEVRADLAKGDYGLATGVAPAPDRPDELAFIKLVKGLGGLGSAVQFFEDSVMDVLVITMVRLSDGTWRVWGLGDYRKASDVFL